MDKIIIYKNKYCVWESTLHIQIHSNQYSWVKRRFKFKNHKNKQQICIHSVEVGVKLIIYQQHSMFTHTQSHRSHSTYRAITQIHCITGAPFMFLFYLNFFVIKKWKYLLVNDNMCSYQIKALIIQIYLFRIICICARCSFYITFDRVKII